jgi:hypothetical protein
MPRSIPPERLKQITNLLESDIMIRYRVMAAYTCAASSEHVSIDIIAPVDMKQIRIAKYYRCLACTKL